MDLGGALKQYETDGYAVFRGVIDEDLIAEARSHIEWLQEKYPDLRPEEFHHPLIRNDAFWTRLVTDERLLDIAEGVLGPDVACFTAHYISKPPYDGQTVLWHQDGSYWKLDPMQAVTLWLAVDASTPENGCLRVIPGSHVESLHSPKVRTDIPNMLSSETTPDVVARWSEEHDIVDVVLEPGDVSIHHPHILHYSEPNVSPRRRCGLDMGFMPASTRISNEGLYLDALLVRGNPVPGINTYRPYPLYEDGETIPFRGHEEWDERARRINAQFGFSNGKQDESPLEMTQHMIERLREGTVKQ